MSHENQSSTLLAESFDASKGNRLASLSFGFAAFAALICVIGFFQDRTQFAFSWLFGFFVVFSICVGALFWAILHHATDAEWSTLVRRQMENVASLIPVLSVFFLPLLIFCAPILWKWWAIDPKTEPLLAAKAGYLNKSFFIVRYLFYFVSLGWVAMTLRNRSIAQDKDGASSHTFAMRRASILGLPLLAVSLTFAAVDWLMGLDYHWFSTMWGVYVFAGAAGSSMALLVILVFWLKDQGLLKAVNSEHYHIMGKFMFAFTVFWAYIGYSQYMLIWYANIPEETIYFKIRNTESWHLLSTCLVVGRFFVPFPILLFQYSKRNPRILSKVGLLMVVMQIVDIYVIVLPAFHSKGASFSIMDLAALIAVASAALGLFFRRLASCPLFPLKDPRLSGSLNLHN